MGSEGALYMMRMSLSTPRLFEMGRRMRLPLGDVDAGYLVHCALRALFGEDAPQPFSVETGMGRALDVLGYARRSAEELRERAQAVALPDVYECCDWSRFASKPMPALMDRGARLEFAVRVCPVVRLGREHEKEGRKKGTEVDAFLAACWKAGKDVKVSREEVYTRWFRSLLARGGDVVEVSDLRVVRFQREKLLRRMQGEGRKPRLSERPDVTLGGVLEVKDPEGFGKLLGHGVGRHRAFGFGMILLKRIV